MNEPKHTPGPWKVEEPWGWNFCIRSGDSFIATVGSGEGGRGQKKANAHLMAAAPELLEALKAMVVAHGGVSVMPTAEAKAQNVASDAARAAIAKAEGKAV